MKRWGGYLLTGIAIYFLGLLALLPPEVVLGNLIPRLEAQGIRLAARGLSGTVWSGGAEALVVNGLRLDRVRWSSAPWRLVTGKIGLSLGGLLPGGEFDSRLSIGPQAGRAEALDAGFRADMLTRYIKLPVVPGGNVSLHVDELEWQGDLVTSMRGRVVWRQAQLTAPQQLPFGDLVIDLTPREGGGVQGKLSDGGGPLMASGDLTFDPSGSYRIDARLAARDKAPPELGQALAFLGKPDAQGRVRLTFSGRL